MQELELPFGQRFEFSRLWFQKYHENGGKIPMSAFRMAVTNSTILVRIHFTLSLYKIVLCCDRIKLKYALEIKIILNCCSTLTEKTKIQVEKESSNNRNVQVPQLDQKQTSAPFGAVAVVNDIKCEKKEIDEGEATLEPSIEDPMKEETDVCFEDKNTDDKREVTELLAPKAPKDNWDLPADGQKPKKANEPDQAEALDSSSSIWEEDGEQEKEAEENMSEIAGSEVLNSLSLSGDISIKRSEPSG